MVRYYARRHLAGRPAPFAMEKDDALRDVPALVTFAWEALLGVACTDPITYYSSLSDDFKQFARERVDIADIERSVSEAARREGIDPSPVLEGLRQIRDQVLSDMEKQIERFVEELRMAEEQRPTPARIDIRAGNIGVVQTGSHAAACVTQNIAQGDREALTEALRMLEGALLALDGTQVPDRGVVLQATRECREEIEKPTSTLTKVRMLVTGLAAGIETLAALPEAGKVLKEGMEALKAALPAWGIPVPW